MSNERSRDCLVRLLHELYAFPRESERVEFMAGAIAQAHPGAAPKLMRYLPFWASAPMEGQA